ncbi:MAG: glycoside hydrolase family protein, partial [Thermoanaerobaculia bacterium]
GVWTRGYGETEGIGPHSRCVTKREAGIDLRRRLNRDYLPAVPRLARLRRRERDALASFAYNLGTRAVSDPSYSTLARRLKGREGRTYRRRRRVYRAELPKWVNAGGRPLAGLRKRRAAEVRLATRGDYSGRP